MIGFSDDLPPADRGVSKLEMSGLRLREGETVGEYVSRLEARLRALEPPEGFTVQEWHVGQVFAYLCWCWPSDCRSKEESDALLVAFRKRFPEQVDKFAAYMDWKLKPRQ